MFSLLGAFLEPLTFEDIITHPSASFDYIYISTAVGLLSPLVLWLSGACPALCESNTSFLPEKLINLYCLFENNKELQGIYCVTIYKKVATVVLQLRKKQGEVYIVSVTCIVACVFN